LKVGKWLAFGEAELERKLDARFGLAPLMQDFTGGAFQALRFLYFG
jgi:hypothetical protein